MLLSWHLLLIHLKTDLIGSGVIKILNVITLLNLPELEADQSFIYEIKFKLLYIKFDIMIRAYRGCIQSTSVEHH